MPLPRLLHKVDCIIVQLDKASTYYDDDAREVIQEEARAVQKTVSGQVKWGTQFGLEPTKLGAREGASGYVLFRKVDLDAAGITLQNNDRIAKMGHVVCDLYVDRIEHTSHYPDQNGPALVKAHFSDRRPAEQTRGVA